MNLNQCISITNSIEELLSLDIDKTIANFYENEQNISKKQIDQLNIGDFISLTKRILRQISKEINSPDGFILPYNYNVPDVGQSNLHQVINDLKSYIVNNQLSSAEKFLFWLIQYALQNGFYDKSKYKSYPLEEIDFSERNDKLSLLETNLNNLKKYYDELLENIKSTTEEINSYYSQKQTELRGIEANLTSSRNDAKEIADLLSDSNVNKAKIDSILEQVEKEKERIEALNRESKTTFTGLKDSYTELLEQLDEKDKLYKYQTDKFEKYLSFVVSKEEYFKERNEYLDALIGREVGASLFETFKQRKTELNQPLKFWRWAVAIMGGLTFIVVIAIFTNFFGRLGEIPKTYSWEIIVVNFIKTIPFFFLLYYAIAQYNKERNYQEEYAFKSATALTIKAYADILKTEENKDQLILRSVYNVYRNAVSGNKNMSDKDVNGISDLLGEVFDKAADTFVRKK